MEEIIVSKKKIIIRSLSFRLNWRNPDQLDSICFLIHDELTYNRKSEEWRVINWDNEIPVKQKEYIVDIINRYLPKPKS